MGTYRASEHVEQGVANEHAYNMFLSFEEICCRLGLWDNSIGWLKCQTAYHRLTQGMPYRRRTPNLVWNRSSP